MSLMSSNTTMRYSYHFFSLFNSSFLSLLEMIKGTKYSGPEVDIWSIGVILYTILCGYLPFDDDNEARIHSKILSLEYEIPSHISEQAKSMIQLILQIDPKARLTMDQILNHQWLDVIEIEKDFQIFSSISSPHTNIEIGDTDSLFVKEGIYLMIHYIILFT